MIGRCTTYGPDRHVRCGFICTDFEKPLYTCSIHCIDCHTVKLHVSSRMHTLRNAIDHRCVSVCPRYRDIHRLIMLRSIIDQCETIFAPRYMYRFRRDQPVTLFQKLFSAHATTFLVSRDPLFWGAQLVDECGMLGLPLWDIKLLVRRTDLFGTYTIVWGQNIKQDLSCA